MATIIETLPEYRNRIAKRDRILAEIGRQARMNPRITWAQWLAMFEGWSAHLVESFIRSCGERVSETTLSKTWPMVIAVIRSWADSDIRVLAVEARR